MKKLCCFFLLLIFLIANNCTGPKIELRFNVKPGTIYTYRVTTDQLISQTIKGQALDMNQTIIMEHRYEVIEINDAGNTIKGLRPWSVKSSWWRFRLKAVLLMLKELIK
jgi:hypothetical protein